MEEIIKGLLSGGADASVIALAFKLFSVSAKVKELADKVAGMEEKLIEVLITLAEHAALNKRQF